MSDIARLIAGLSLQQRTTLLQLLRRSVGETDEGSTKAPIAIIGMGCRFPGGANDPEAFWRLMRDGVDAITEVPSERWDLSTYYDADARVPGKMSTRWGGFLADVDRFDPHFFGIAPREAASMDPQQRLLLEVAWEALEQGGQAPDRLAGSRTGVFLGISSDDYAQFHLRSGDAAAIDAYSGTGVAWSVAAGRLSFVMGFEGPALSIDTACSSSLAAVHLACQSLRLGECRLALAGGVNLILAPEPTIYFSKVQAMAADGRCKAFDRAADGYVRGEGCGVVVLKRLADAVADGDTVLALIRGSALNHDGHGSGLTVPNGPAQQAVIREALAQAGVEPARISYVEAHGTGTALGDPIEMNALGAVLGESRSAEHRLLVGSVKTNIGHVEAAAGIAGLIKVVLALQHAEIPSHLHLHERSPHIPWDVLPVHIPTARMPWPALQKPRLAGVSAFGFSGTNAHVVLEEAPARAAAAVGAARPIHLLTLSAKSAEALRVMAGNYSRHIEEHPQLSVEDVCFTANTGRTHFAHRLALVEESVSQSGAALASVAAGQDAAGVVRGEVQRAGRPKVAFLFTGQGSQYVGMGRQLYETQPVFREVIDRCDAWLRANFQLLLLPALYPRPGEASPLDETKYAQPALFAVELALAELWRSWGIVPSAVLGHSVGEYAAACVAGVFGWEDGLKLVAERGRLMQSLQREGAMTAVFAAEEQVAAAVGRHGSEVSIAAINGPGECVISGARGAVQSVCGQLRSEGIRIRPLRVSHAFHSPLLEPMLDAFERAASTVSYSPPRLGLVSNVTGKMVSGGGMSAAAYWRRQARLPVQFAAGVTALRQQGCELFVELGPSPVLLANARRSVPDEEGVWLPSLRRGHDDWRSLLTSLGTLYARGVDVDWNGFHRPYPARRLALPTYPFERQRYWVDARPKRQPLAAGPFESRLDLSSFPWLTDHRVYGSIVFPAAGYLEMALAAGRQIFANPILEEIVLRQALVVPEGQKRQLRVVLTPLASGASSLEIASGDTVHVTGTVRSGSNILSRAPLAEIQRRCSREVPVGAFYERAQKMGLTYGPSFRGIVQLWCEAGEALGLVRPPTGLHPALLDACLQVLGATAPGGLTAYLPFAIERLAMDETPASCVWCHAELRPGEGWDRDTVTADLYLFDDGGKLFATITGLQVKRAGPAAFSGPCRDWLYEVQWRPKALTRRVSPQTIAARLPKAEESHPPDLVAGLDRLSSAYIARAFGELGFQSTLHEGMPAASLGMQWGVVPQHCRLFGHLLERFRHDGAGAEADPENLRDALLARHPAHRAELALLGRCGPHLADVLRGTVNPLDLLFPQGSFGDMEQFYQESPFARIANARLRAALEMALEQHRNRPLRVLEIGAGAGGTTAALLPGLDAERVEYVFTDVSPLFLARAEQKFHLHPWVRYALLDIENDPLPQGFSAGEFDLVIAANVLHATRAVSESLQHIRRLLEPAGMLLLLEATSPQRWLDLVFGLTEGWWRFTDHEVRTYPLMSESQWLASLQQAGFSQTAAAPVNDQVSIFLAHAEVAGSWLILGDRGGIGDQLAAQLRKRGEPCEVLYSPEKLPDAGFFEQSLRTAWRGMVHLWTLDAPPLDATTLDTLTRAQQLGCGSVLPLVQACARAAQPGVPKLWLVTRKSVSQAPLAGLAGVLAQEHPELSCVCLDLDSGSSAEDVAALMVELDSTDGEDRVAWRGGERYVARLARQQTERTEDSDSVCLRTPTPGLLDNLQLEPAPRRAPRHGEVQLRVRATGLNFRDVLNALGMYPGEPQPLGAECAGTVVSVGEGVTGLAAGDEVVALAPASFATYVTCAARWVVPKPEGLSLAAAASLPGAYLTAGYALEHLAHLAPGERVLIHAAAGGVGLAAVQIAQRIGAEIFTTAGNEEKRAYLRSLGIRHVFDSRSLDFAVDVRAATGGAGVDVVLNSLAGEFLARSLQLVRPGGRFVDLSKPDPSGPAPDVPEGIAYHIFDLGEVCQEQPELMQAMLKEVLAEAAAGCLRLLPRREFPLADSVRVFRTMAQAKHIGKFVLTQQAPAARLPVKCNAHGTYLITGGVGGLGLAAARWLVERGARHLMLLARHPASETAAKAIEQMRAAGAEVSVVQGDVTDHEQMEYLFEDMSRSGFPLRGVIHAAGLLDDGIVLQQTWDRFARVLAPKVDGTWIIHTLTKHLALDFFVLFSSAATLLGPAGQGNHAAANAFLDALAQYRRSEGQTALSINWGVWAEIGAAAERHATEQAASRGMGAIAPQEGLATLEEALMRDVAQVAVLPIDWDAFEKHAKGGSTRPFFAELLRKKGAHAPAKTAASRQVPQTRPWLDAAPRDRQRLLLAHVGEQIRKVLGWDAARPLDPRQPLQELGLDSLMAVELRNALSVSLGRTLPATLLFDYPTIEALHGYLGREVLPREEVAAQLADSSPEDEALSGAAARIEQLSEEEAEALLMQRLEAGGSR